MKTLESSHVVQIKVSLVKIDFYPIRLRQNKYQRCLLSNQISQNQIPTAAPRTYTQRNTLYRSSIYCSAQRTA